MIVQIKLEINIDSNEVDAQINLDEDKDPEQLDIDKVASIVNRVFTPENRQLIKEMARVEAKEFQQNKLQNLN